MREIPHLFRAMAQILQEARSEAKISQRDLAQAIGCARSFIESIEHEQNQPSIQTFLLISEALGILPEEMIKRLRARLMLLESTPRPNTKKTRGTRL